MYETEFYKDASLIGVFDSMEQFMQAALNPPVKNRLRKNWQAWINGLEGEVKWHGLRDEPAFSGGRVRTAAVCKLVSEGWRRGAEKIERAFESIDCAAVPMLVRRRRVHTDQGDSLDIHAVYRGALETAWDKCAARTQRGPQRVTIVNDALDSGGTDSDRMFWRGAAVCALTDKLVRAGYAVQVISGWSGYMDSGVTICRVQVKSFTAPVDLLTLAAAVALPAFFRSIGHTWGCGWAAQQQGTGFGVRSLQAMPDEILMSNRSAVCSAATAGAWVAEQINALQADREQQQQLAA